MDQKKEQDENEGKDRKMREGGAAGGRGGGEEVSIEAGQDAGRRRRWRRI